jgi:hypothetical protein
MNQCRFISISILAVLLFTACSPVATPGMTTTPPSLQPATATAQLWENPYAPQAGDKDMTHVDVQVTSASLIFGQTQPPQVLLNFLYTAPSPCDQLRVVIYLPDPQNQINVSVYSLFNNNKPCTLLPVDTPLQASLNLGSYPKGHYSVWVNGLQSGEFDS